ncbi:MAG: thiamine phosphate synthase [Candidatus Dormibacteraeota bacterium]|nr:thiamine phosphate synthase [Candidatus Dormibacteraeota bacterium]
MAVVADAAAGVRAAGRGATIIQLRRPGDPGGGLEAEMVVLLQATRLPVLVGGRADVALATGAAGVHLPEQDLPVVAARRLLGPERLVGRSVHSVAAAESAEAEGADYVLFGAVFPSPGHEQVAGLEELARVAAAVRIPVLAVGGVSGERVEACRRAGAAGFAAIRYFQGPPP